MPKGDDVDRENKDQTVVDARLSNTNAIKPAAAQRKKANIVFASALNPRTRHSNCDFRTNKRVFCTEVLYARAPRRKTKVEPEFSGHPLPHKTCGSNGRRLSGAGFHWRFKLHCALAE